MDHALAVSANLVASLVGALFSLGILGAIGWLILLAIRAPFVEADREQRVAEAARTRTAEIQSQKLRAAAAPKPVGIRVPLGVTTGLLRSRGQAGGVPAGTHLIVEADLAARGIVVVGPSGSGKTRAVLQPFTGHWLESDPRAGMFAFSEKPNWGKILVRIARAVGRDPATIHVVGPGGAPWPLLRGLAPDAVADFVRTAISLAGTTDAFFSSSAENLVRRVAGVLHAVSRAGALVIEPMASNGDHLDPIVLDYDLASVSRLSRMTPAEMDVILPEIRARAMILDARGDADAKRRIDLHLPEIEKTLGSSAEKQREGITATIDAVLAPFFTEAAFTDAFSGDGTFDLGVLDQGHVVILDVDRNLYPGAATLAFLLGFAQMTQHMRSRIARQDDGEDLNDILFVADEYAQVADKKTHPAMWRVAREARVCPLIAYQVHTDLQGVLSREIADGMIANFTTRIVFPTSDPSSVALVSGGKAEVERESSTTNESWSSGKNAGMHGQGFSSGTSDGTSGGTSSAVSLQEREVVDVQLMDSLANRIVRGVPVENQVAEVVVRTVQGSRRVLDVCRVKAWDPPR